MTTAGDLFCFFFLFFFCGPRDSSSFAISGENKGRSVVVVRFVSTRRVIAGKMIAKEKEIIAKKRIKVIIKNKEQRKTAR